MHRHNVLILIVISFLSFSLVVHKSDNDQVTNVGAGITLQEANTAAYDARLSKLRPSLPSGVVDPFTLNKELLLECSKATNGCFVTVEDYYPKGHYY